MSHFAKINENNVVVYVAAAEDSEMSEDEALAFFEQTIGGRWIQTSYNTFLNTHANGGTPLRKNYAAVGMLYDESLDAFIYPKPERYPSYVFNSDTGSWEPPLPFPGIKPEDPRVVSLEYLWDEENVQWIPNPDLQ